MGFVENVTLTTIKNNHREHMMMLQQISNQLNSINYNLAGLATAIAQAVKESQKVD